MKKSKIGGQAVIEGVMMRGKTAAALSCRDEKGRIRTKTWRLDNKGKKWKKIPILRGVLSFVSSMAEGVKTLMDSAEIFGEEEEPSKFEKWIAKKFKIDIIKVVIVFAVVLGIGLAVGLFVILPSILSKFVVDIFNIEGNSARLWIEGGIKILILFAYIILTSLLSDIKRVYMYHGAEHKTINAYENELELTVENVRKSKKFHNRCGTTFLFFVVLVSILVSAVLDVEGEVLRVLVRIACLPLVAGLAYELLMVVANVNFFLFYPLRLPGMLLQKITTREPDDKMIEVAIRSFVEVLKLDEDEKLSTYDDFSFKYYTDVVKSAKKVLDKAKVDYDADIEWIVSDVLGVKRSELRPRLEIKNAQFEKIMDIVKIRATHKPLWQILGKTNFYGLDIKVDKRALIPRNDTESLVFESLNFVKENSKVLDLCCGTSAIALAVKHSVPLSIVTASDISDLALSLAKENADELKLDINYIKSDMFENLKGQKFDVIISNPPYIKRSDISALQEEVKDFEPMNALDGGEDGLDFYKIIANNVKDYLCDTGTLLVEVGFDQADDVSQLLSANGFKTEIKKDMQQVDRIVVGRFKDNV